MRVLITGASSGIGKAAARRFYKGEWTPVLAARRGDRLKELAEELGGCPWFELDVTDRGAVERVLRALEVDAVINSAGLALGLGPFHEGEVSDWEQMVATNVLGMLYVTRAVLPGMVKRGRGHVLNIGSVAGTYPYPGGNVYGGTKAFVHQFTLNLKADLMGTGVRATCVEPGLCETEFSVVRFKGDRAKAGEVYRGAHPLTGEDIAEVLFIAATLPPHVNLNTIEVMPTSQAFARLPVHRE